jgi:hypothetical protein
MVVVRTIGAPIRILSDTKIGTAISVNQVNAQGFDFVHIDAPFPSFPALIATPAVGRNN